MLFLLLALLSAALAQGSYEWRDVAQDVDIRSDGTLIVNDERTLVATSGDFNEAFICLDLGANQSLELLDGGALGPGPSAQAYTQPCEDGSGGTELVVEMDDEVRVSERRVFYRYALSGALDYYSDVVQWYWIIMEQDHPPVRGYTLDVFIPGTMQAPFDAFVYRFDNPESPAVRLAEGRNRLTVTFEQIPDGDGVEVRYLMDPALFEQQGDREALEYLLRYEKSASRSNPWERIDDLVQRVDIQADGTVIVEDARTVGGRRVFDRRVLNDTLDYHSDVVQWYQTVLRRNRPPVSGYELTVITPGSMSAPYDAYAYRTYDPDRSPEPLAVSLSDARDELRVTLDYVPRGEGVEVRYLMDPGLFDERGSGLELSRLLRDEEQLVRGLERRERLRNIRDSVWQQILTWLSLVPPQAIISPHWAVIAFVVGIVGIRRDYQRVKRRHVLPEPQYLFEPPDDLPPALVSALIYEFGNELSDTEAFRGTNMTHMKMGFSATVMDLARRGYGEFRASPERSSGLLGIRLRRPSVKFEMQLNLDKDQSDLLPFERRVLSYLLSAARRNGDPSYLDFEELRDHSRKRWRTFYERWYREMRAQAHHKFLPYHQSRYTDESWRAYRRWTHNTYKTAALGVVAAIAPFALNDVLGVVDSIRANGTTFYWYVWAVIGLFIAAFLLNVFAKRLLVMHDEVVIALNNWQAFAQTLSDYSIMERAPNDFYKLWDRYFCYAAALGVASFYLANVKRGFADHGFDEQRVFRETGWLQNNTDNSSLDNARNIIDPSALSSAIESVTAALQAERERSSSSSGGGGGGGAASSGGSSSGGGGGGGGGSSGGR